MKKAAKILGVLVAIILFLTALLFIFNYDYILRGLQVVYLKGHTTAYIDDYPEFDNRTIEAGENYEPWPLATNYNSVSVTSRLQETHNELETVAFLIIKMTVSGLRVMLKDMMKTAKPILFQWPNPLPLPYLEKQYSKDISKTWTSR